LNDPGCFGIGKIAEALISWLLHTYVRFVYFPRC